MGKAILVENTVHMNDIFYIFGGGGGGVMTPFIFGGETQIAISVDFIFVLPFSFVEYTEILAISADFLCREIHIDRQKRVIASM